MDGIGAFPDRGSKGAVKVVGRLRFQDLKRDAQPRGGRGGWGETEAMHCAGRVDKDGHASCSWDHLLQELQLFRCESLRCESAEAGNIPAGAREAWDESEADRI